MSATTFTTSTMPAAWVGCLACYNEGRLVGDWFSAIEAGTVTTYDIHDAHSRADNHDELWCFDHEGIPVRDELDPRTAALWSELIVEVHESDRAAFYAWALSGDAITNADGLPCRDDFEDLYCGTWESFGTYAKQLADDIALLDGVPEEIGRYFDWNAWTRDLQFDYTVLDADSGVFVFRVL